MKVYYNEFDKKKCAALNALMEDGHISKGDIDDRPIQEVQSNDLQGYTRCHFFAGIGLWDYALDLAGWGEEPVWTGSCPCQPFSSAGRQKGKTDERHLWPEWLRLIKECNPSTIFGEQVASAVTHGWLDDVYQGLETENYAVGAVVLPASSVGAPHRRERLWFVAHSSDFDDRRNTREFQGADEQQAGKRQERWATEPCCSSIVGNAEGARTRENKQGLWEMSNRPCKSNIWHTGQWIDCPDKKQRLVEPRIPLLAHGYPERVGVIHCAGDAIVPQVAAEVIKASMNYKEQSQ